MISGIEKYVAYILLCLMIASLLPVMYLGRYNHPTGDDYYYGADTKIVWEETGSVMETFAEAVRGVAYQYHRWQGTYSAMLLMYLPPNIFGGWAYHLVTSVILLLLCGGIFYLLKPVVHVVIKGTAGLWIIVSSLLALLCVQTVSFQGESFFWYNGSIYYTGYYALTLFFFGLAVRYVISPKRRHVPVMLFMAAFLAGGNYVSLLPALLIMLLLTACLVWKRHACAMGIGAVTLLLLACFLVSILAPGNQVRKDGMWSIPAWKAILKALLQGFRYTAAWTGIWLILALLIMTPFLWRTLSKINFRFRYPVLAIGLFYGLFCSMSCPTFYTMNSTGPARVVAIVYYGFLLFVFISYYYLLGYCHRMMEKKSLRPIPPDVPGTAAGRAALVCALLLIAVQIVTGAVSNTTTGRAIGLLVSGEAAAYEQEYQERLRILEDSAVQDVVFKPYGNQPAMLYVGDFASDAGDETNQKAARYFHKNSICVEYGAP